ncbi:MAG: hypothetical protein QF682_12135 [Candidatus Thermoplasmatota archaeon]|nr:hypothetical protein [Candidatus Thermoplasmatota archaeon]
MLKRPPFNSSFTIMILVTIMLLCFQMIGNIEFSLSQTAAADNNWEPFWDSDFDDWTLSDLIIDWDGNLTLERVSGNYSGSGNATSTPMNTGADGIWKTLNWEASTAQNTSVSFQIRNGSSLAECNSNRFSGPNGLDSYYTISGSAIAEDQNRGEWIQFAVFFNSTDTNMTPSLDNVSATFNFFPRLQGGVSIVYSYGGKSYNFTSTYSDRNNAPPSLIEVIIDGVNHPMIEKDGNDTDYSEGKEFLYNTTLSAGQHSYHYIASDGELNCSSIVKSITVEEEIEDPGDDDDDDPAMDDLKSIDIFPKNEIVVIGGTIHFNAEGINKTGDHMAINTTWAVNGGGAMDEYGLFTAMTAGNWFVYANVSGVPGRTTFTVSDGKLHTITITPGSASVPLGGLRSFTFQGFDKLGLSINFDPVWSVNGGGTIDNNGEFSALRLGTWTVYANASGISGTATVSVGGLSRIEIYSNETTENETYINLSESIKYIAKGYDSEDKEINFDPIWSVNGGGTIFNGTFTATAPGRRVITASFGDVEGTANVTVIMLDIPQDDDDNTKDDPAAEEKPERSVDKFRKWAKNNFPTVMLLLVLLLLFFSVLLYFVFRKKKPGDETEDEYSDEDWAEEISPDERTWGKPLIREEKLESEDTNEWEELDTISEWDTWTVTDYDLESAKPVKKRYRRERRGRYRPEMDDKIEWDTGPLGRGKKKTWSRYKPLVKKRRGGKKKKHEEKSRKEDHLDEDGLLDYDDAEEEVIDYGEEDHRYEDDRPEFVEEDDEDEEDAEYEEDEGEDEDDRPELEEQQEEFELDGGDVDFWEEEILDDNEEADFWYEE